MTKQCKFGLSKCHSTTGSVHHTVKRKSHGEGIIGLDREGRITLLNPAATVICGWSAADCLGEKLSTLGLLDVDDEHRIPEYQTLAYRSYRMGQAGHSDKMAAPGLLDAENQRSTITEPPWCRKALRQRQFRRLAGRLGHAAPRSLRVIAE